jgi:hypothetical protein
MLTRWKSFREGQDTGQRQLRDPWWNSLGEKDGSGEWPSKMWFKAVLLELSSYLLQSLESFKIFMSNFISFSIDHVGRTHGPAAVAFTHLAGVGCVCAHCMCMCLRVHIGIHTCVHVWLGGKGEVREAVTPTHQGAVFGVGGTDSRD